VAQLNLLSRGHQGEWTGSRQCPQLVEGGCCRGISQLRAKTAGEFGIAVRVVVIPPAQLCRGSHLFAPPPYARIRCSQSARPEPVDKNPDPVVGIRIVVDPCYPHRYKVTLLARCNEGVNMAGQRSRMVTAIAIALIATSSLAGCGTKQSESVTTSTASPLPTATSAANATAAPTPAAPTMPARIEKWIDLKAGDCLAGLPSTDPAVVTVTVVDCATPHLAEVYLRAAIPVDAAVTGTTDQQCQAGVTQYTGVPLTGSPYTLFYLIDSEQDRTSNNPLPSTVICLLQGAQGQSFSTSAHR